MIVPVFPGWVKNGKLVLDSPAALQGYLAGMNGRVQVTVKSFKRNRSTNQNSYYWGVVIKLLAMELGYDTEECHEAMKWQFLRVEHDGKPPTVRSTTALDTAEFSEYCEKVKQFAAVEFGVVIPDPDQVEFL